MADPKTHRKQFLQGMAAMAAALVLWPRKASAAPVRASGSASSQPARFPVEARRAPRAVEHRV